MEKVLTKTSPIGTRKNNHWYRRAETRPSPSNVGQPFRVDDSAETREFRRKGVGAGFTLIELSVVIFILGLTLSFVLPRLMTLEAVELKHAARRLSGTIRYLSEQAEFAETLYILTCNLDKGTYQAKYCLPEKDPPHKLKCWDDRSSLGKEIKLPNGVQFQDIILMGEKVDPEEGGSAVIPFFPDGYIVPVLIHLKDEGKNSYTLELNPVTGRVKIMDGYVDAKGQTPPS